MLFVAESTPDSIERRELISSCNDNLRLLKRLLSPDDGIRAKMAAVDKLHVYLSDYLCRGIETSILRYHEVCIERLTRFTDAVNLYVPQETGGDFKVRIWLNKLAGETISEAAKESVEKLRLLLGDYVFEGMETSRWLADEKKIRSSAIYISFPTDKDCMLEVMLGFERGKDIFTNLYPN